MAREFEVDMPAEGGNVWPPAAASGNNLPSPPLIAPGISVATH
jgi:hypothetical protein